MANNETVETSKKWYCHTCEAEVVPNLTDYNCSVCAGGFIEELTQEENESSTEETTQDSSQNPSSQRAEVRDDDHTDRPPLHENRPLFANNPFGFGFPPLFPNNPHATHPPHATDILQGFVEQIWSGLTGGMNTGQMTFHIPLAPQLFNSNTGDYVWSTEGLDNIVTMLMNQLDVSGPPPAAKEQVDALPVLAIRQEQVDEKLQCHICMENFQLEEMVKELPCRHVYHTECIVPWLELHGTCPVCRKRIDANSTTSSACRFHSGNRS